VTIVELPEFIRRSQKLLSDEERARLFYFLATNPLAGNLIRETGGIRKFRWASKNKGKRGSVRVIYFYYQETMPLFMLTAFAKKDKTNISASERNKLRALTKKIVSGFGENDE